MRFYVVDFKKGYVHRTFLKIAIAFILLIAVSIGVITKLYGKELFIEAATGISEEKIIILDAGHGGEDCGAIGVDGVYEKDLNLEITLEIGKRLEEAGYIVVYTRTDDRLLYGPDEDIKGIRKISDLKNRCKIAAKYPNSIFVSIHMNSFASSKYSGLQVYYSEKNTESSIIAGKIQDEVRESLQHSNKRVTKKGEGIYLLEHVENPAVLIECGFLTNPEECQKLSLKEYQKSLSFAIVCGIIEYVENKN